MTKGKNAQPVMEICDSNLVTYPSGGTLPSIWISARLMDESGEDIGRTDAWLYPDSDYDDEAGNDALWYGADYYDEAMSYADPVDHDKRVDCFRAAEILYRHSAARGNVIACLCLGYVYSYDRCEGRYWVDPSKAAESSTRSFPRKERAFECLRIAADAGIPEACYKLGDMYKYGTGCEPDVHAAFQWYAQAADNSKGEQPVILGSIALRLAECYEEGFGCEHSFDRALKWYQQAVAGLEVAVESGETWYAKALASARAGVKRCKQEANPNGTNSS